jgi:RND family efflux transporter MFP subunit
MPARWALAGVALLAAVPAVRADSLGCLIAPSRVINVGAPVTGVLAAVKVERGDRVAKGQLLATLRADLERAQVDLAGSRARADADLLAAQKSWDFARRKLERNEDLFRKEFVSAQLVEQSRTEAELARARLRQAEEQSRHSGKELGVANAQLRLRSVKSPIDGVVLERYLAEGERVEDRPILRVATLDPLHVEVVMPSTVYGQVHLGQEAQVQAELAGLAPLGGRVILVDQVIDPASNTFRARLELPNPEGRVPAGLRCKASFTAVVPAVAAPARTGSKPESAPSSARYQAPVVAAQSHPGGGTPMLPAGRAVAPAPAPAPALTPGAGAAAGAARSLPTFQLSHTLSPTPAVAAAPARAARR